MIWGCGKIFKATEIFLRKHRKGLIQPEEEIADGGFNYLQVLSVREFLNQGQ